MSIKFRQIFFGLTLAIILVATILFVWIARPFPCLSQEHSAVLSRIYESWHRGEISDKDALTKFITFAELKPPFWEKPTYMDEEAGYRKGYSTVNQHAVRVIGEIDTPEAFEKLCYYATYMDRNLNGCAVFELEKQGNKQAVPALMELLEIENNRERENLASGTLSHNPHLLTCHVLSSIKKLARQESLPLLKEFLDKKDRRFKYEIEEAIFGLENDITKPINVEDYQVIIKKLNKTTFLPDEEMMLEYSITSPIGKPVKLCAFEHQISIDGKVVQHFGPNIYRGGFLSNGGLSLKDLFPGTHTLTIKIKDTEKSDTKTFYIQDEPQKVFESLSDEN
jgi:hypothetical protein